MRSAVIFAAATAASTTTTVPPHVETIFSGYCCSDQSFEPSQAFTATTTPAAAATTLKGNASATVSITTAISTAEYAYEVSCETGI